MHVIRAGRLREGKIQSLFLIVEENGVLTRAVRLRECPLVRNLSSVVKMTTLVSEREICSGDFREKNRAKFLQFFFKQTDQLCKSQGVIYILNARLGIITPPVLRRNDSSGTILT